MRTALRRVSWAVINDTKECLPVAPLRNIAEKSEFGDTHRRQVLGAPPLTVGSDVVFVRRSEAIRPIDTYSVPLKFIT